ncbi:UDP-glucuronosyltransferase 2A1-like [Elysia marginata]|uniref:UDP-glucuronosyltransferase 2A1-like n=1 Tax=Elysia marginata TaxID=1093978 RepID=A0AAV4I333_9GAST|nr:UDP-glucuronosyltransferase 2A1-like [Elysia marginata]
MQGTVNGGRTRGRQRKRWEDNIKEWTGLELTNTLRIADDREEWKAVVRRSSMRPDGSQILGIGTSRRLPAAAAAVKVEVVEMVVPEVVVVAVVVAVIIIIIIIIS